MQAFSSSQVGREQRRCSNRLAVQRAGGVYLVAGHGRGWRRLQAAEMGESRLGESNLGEGGAIPATVA